ncbi:MULTISPECIES: TetR/AcrR family transcriptional regulator [unclassified Mycobacterium]|uniref:TetR/AcrR family transcriptional regulator n=1 Tax=unclassified Mycobacterium TaxID=2642494 RepID=UPI0029C73B03|nr:MULTISPECIES: TetR/AcrR family transcriptional regulator [unclassified Mycobacterium]
MSSESPTPDGPARGADPQRRSKEAVKSASLAAAYELLTEAGFSGVSFDEVSRRSGVAKTTIYRYWPTRSALLFDAVMQFAPRLPTPATGNLQADLTALALALAQRLQTGRWSSALPSIIDAAERDQEVADLQLRTHAGMISGFSTIAARAQERGELDASFDVSELTANIAGPIFYRRWFARQEIDDAFVCRVVERALHAS